MLAAFGGAVASMLVAALIGADHDLGQVVPALALMVVVVAAAGVGGRAAGVWTAVFAALSFNFWHTQPYRSLRIHDLADVVTTLLLLAAGLLVGAVAHARETVARDAARERAMLAVLAIQADLLARGASADDVWAVTRRALLEHLELQTVRFEPFGTEAPALPRLNRGEPMPRLTGARITFHRLGRRGLLLPDDGAEIVVGPSSRPIGRLVLLPAPDAEGVSTTARYFALALAEQLGTVLTRDVVRPLA